MLWQLGKLDIVFQPRGVLRWSTPAGVTHATKWVAQPWLAWKLVVSSPLVKTVIMMMGSSYLFVCCLLIHVQYMYIYLSLFFSSDRHDMTCLMPFRVLVTLTWFQGRWMPESLKQPKFHGLGLKSSWSTHVYKSNKTLLKTAKHLSSIKPENRDFKFTGFSCCSLRCAQSKPWKSTQPDKQFNKRGRKTFRVVREWVYGKPWPCMTMQQTNVFVWLSASV